MGYIVNERRVTGRDYCRSFPTATIAMTSEAGTLFLYSGESKAGNLIAGYAPGSWCAVIKTEPVTEGASQ